ncbi:MAG: hypothetical protein U9N81_09975 [Bacillota bacterium]|nr:hypothetical protein [Bacillota bacterium]
MKKSLFGLVMMVLCVFILGGSPSTAYAAEEVQTPMLVKSTDNAEIMQLNSKLENIKVISSEDIKEIAKYSNATFKKLDGDMAEITFVSKAPTKINYFNDGSKEELYTKHMYVGDLLPVPGYTGRDYFDFYARVHISAAYSAINVGTALKEFIKLDTGKGTLLEYFDHACKNLKITPATSGNWEDPDGSRGSQGTVRNPRTIPVPVIGQEYSQSGLSTHYFDRESSFITVHVNIDTRHGTEWTTSYFELPLGIH